jgi:hypothetical protein
MRLSDADSDRRFPQKSPQLKSVSIDGALTGRRCGEWPVLRRIRESLLEGGSCQLEVAVKLPVTYHVVHIDRRVYALDRRRPHAVATGTAGKGDGGNATAEGPPRLGRARQAGPTSCTRNS